MAANSQAPANGHFFPKFIDRPMLIGIFEMDEFFVAFCVMVLILVGSFFLWFYSNTIFIKRKDRKWQIKNNILIRKKHIP